MAGGGGGGWGGGREEKGAGLDNCNQLSVQFKNYNRQ